MKLRDYQRDAIAALHAGWDRGLHRLGVSLPTGTGKTHVMCALAVLFAQYGGQHSRGSVLMLVHRDTLVEQTERRAREHAGASSLSVGVVKAGRNVVGANIVIASVHTLRSAARLAQIHQPGLIIVDEAHVSMSDTYDRIFTHFQGARVAGFSATWTRSDARKLGDFWEEIVFHRGIRWAIREGHLVMPRGVSVGMPDGTLSGVRTRGGDYVDSDLGVAISIDEMRRNVVRGYREHGADRPGVLFAPTQDSAEYFGQALRNAGITAAGIYATTSPGDRKAIFASHRRGTTKILTTCSALAEGWDEPATSVALMCRPTKHQGRYIQEVGRVLRPWPGKRDALILDFAGAAQGLSLSLDAVLSSTSPIHNDEVMFSPDGLDPDEVAEQDAAEVDERELEFVVGRETKPVDLFAGTGARWLVTYSGVPFVATRNDLYFVAEVDGSWSVGTCSIDRMQGGRWLAGGLEANEALSYASVVAVDDDASIAGVSASWRRGKPSPAQVARAAALGVMLDADETKSSLSDKLTIQRASATLAPLGS